MSKLGTGLGIGMVLVYLSLAVIMTAGWVNNVIWLITNSDPVPKGQLIVSAVGLLIAPVGSIHGLLVW